MYVLFDIGGTNTRVAISEEGIGINDSRSYQTPQDYNLAIKLIIDTAKLLTKNKKIDGIAGGIRGALDNTKTYLAKDFVLPEYVNKPLKLDLEEALKAKVLLENDSALAALGEATHGAGVGYGIVAYHTVSTGFGGSRIVDGKIDKSSLGFEPGNQIVNISNKLYPEDEGSGRFESYISGIALEKRFGKTAHQIDDVQVWDEMAKLLAVGLNNTTVYWSPDVIVLGGSLMKSIDIEKVKQYLYTKLKIFTSIPEIVLAKLSNNAGLYGALELIKQNLDSRPS